VAGNAIGPVTNPASASPPRALVVSAAASSSARYLRSDILPVVSRRRHSSPAASASSAAADREAGLGVAGGCGEGGKPGDGRLGSPERLLVVAAFSGPSAPCVVRKGRSSCSMAAVKFTGHTNASTSVK
jgi:hypothetical protein